MKTTTLILAALIISISSGTALADSRNHQRDQVVTKHKKIVTQPHKSWQHRDHKAQDQHRQSYNKPIIRQEGKRARIARLIRAKQLRQQQAQYARHDRYNRNLYRHNQPRHEQLRTTTIILPLPIPGATLFFPW
ncbi:MAG: hypothetical protein RBR22_07135 [Desulfuromonas sp.]|nr:hypothetical protein [Desulfuromonas sp.]